MHARQRRRGAPRQRGRPLFHRGLGTILPRKYQLIWQLRLSLRTHADPRDHGQYSPIGDTILLHHDERSTDGAPIAVPWEQLPISDSGCGGARPTLSFWFPVHVKNLTTICLLGYMWLTKPLAWLQRAARSIKNGQPWSLDFGLPGRLQEVLTAMEGYVRRMERGHC